MFSGNLVAHAHTLHVICAVLFVDMCFLVSFAIVVTATPLFVLCIDHCLMDLPLVAHLDLTWQEAHVKEWEQEAHASDSSVQESEYRPKDPSSWSCDTHGSSDREMFARLTRTDSSGESGSVCGPYWVPKPVNSDYIPTALSNLWTTDGMHLVIHHFFLLVYLSTPQSSWQPYPDANASRTLWALR